MASDAAISSFYRKEGFRSFLNDFFSRIQEVSVSELETTVIERFIIAMVGVYGDEFQNLIEKNLTIKQIVKGSKLFKKRSLLQKVFK